MEGENTDIIQAFPLVFIYLIGFLISHMFQLNRLRLV